MGVPNFLIFLNFLNPKPYKPWLNAQASPERQAVLGPRPLQGRGARGRRTTSGSTYIYV